MQEGRALFLKALQHRIHRQWEDARRAFEVAASLGNADALWHLFINDHWSGQCVIDNGEEEYGFDEDKALEYLKEGARLGHPLCVTAKYIVVDHMEREALPKLPSLGAELLCWTLHSDDNARILTHSELMMLKKDAEQAILIHDPWPISLYLKYLAMHPALLRMANPFMIAYGLIVFDEPDCVEYFSPKTHLWTDFEIQAIVHENDFGLPNEMLRMIQCFTGQLAHRFGAVAEYRGNACLDVYQECKQRSDSAAIAWMGCFRRKALAHLSRDTATLIAKMIASPIRWCE